MLESSGSNQISAYVEVSVYRNEYTDSDYGNGILDLGMSDLEQQSLLALVLKSSEITPYEKRQKLHLSRSGFEYSRSTAGSDVNRCTVLSPAAEDTDLFARSKTTAEAKVQAQHMSGNWDTFSTRAVRFVHPYSSPSPFFFFFSYSSSVGRSCRSSRRNVLFFKIRITRRSAEKKKKSLLMLRMRLLTSERSSRSGFFSRTKI
ncbi:hypothetical protein CEXT_371831 [Caerostris extrusa]|uniref:Uncharacterized protein n=1 Tax=Caerostris extrusa TaxID=172846 RepID=A0AAV4YAT2_CAEEX|nr:hypothetical protein CEXT_371831 [Caerostris extrusa]